MMGAFRLVASEGHYLAPQTIERGISGAEAQLARQSRSLPPGIELTDRQLEVLSLIMKGKSNKAICRVLNLAEPTVKNHVTAILRALKVTNRTEAAISARDFGWGPDTRGEKAAMKSAPTTLTTATPGSRIFSSAGCLYSWLSYSCCCWPDRRLAFISTCFNSFDQHPTAARGTPSHTELHDLIRDIETQLETLKRRRGTRLQ